MATRERAAQTESALITDPRAMKALAHPARLAVIEELHVQDELTATECAQLVGLSPSAMSYHLRALEKWGFVERAEPGPDGRERPWRATSQRGWRIVSASPAGAAAESALIDASFDRLRSAMQSWTEVESGQPEAWQNVARLTTSAVWLTSAEAAELNAFHSGFVDRLRGRTAGAHPEGARRVRVALVVAPTPDRGGAQAG